MEVVVYGSLRSATGSKEVTLSPTEQTVAGVIEALCDAYPRAESHLVDDEDALRPSVRVAVDGETADMDRSCPPDAKIEIFPAMRGG
ncbi:ubiquitin-like small modifier protein 1 [Haloglomus salinum]|uniref:ubiquitin-like small modifier protein 1 n=1 Tax=Haloglomus salinum TaxID=2962673 RepID=UPI0020C95A9B|nr:ubiquitin-like small modifier protein 1 [Haloglomus salinum]